MAELRRDCETHHPDLAATAGECRLCWLYVHDDAYNRLWDGPGVARPARRVATSVSRTPAPCAHKGGETRRQLCPTCQGKVELKIFACAVHGECTAAMRADGVRGYCAGCADYDPGSPAPAPTAAGPP